MISLKKKSVVNTNESDKKNELKKKVYNAQQESLSVIILGKKKSLSLSHKKKDRLISHGRVPPPLIDIQLKNCSIFF